MKQDMEMRERRGELRKWGYKFTSDGKRLSTADTLLIQRNNVLPVPLTEEKTYRIPLATKLAQDGTLLLGESDCYGLRVERSGNQLRVFPRLCPHEGRCLDKDARDGENLSCGWHARAIPPIAVVNLNEKNRAVKANSGWNVNWDGSELSLRYAAKEVRAQHDRIASSA